MAEFELRVNGAVHTIDAEAEMPLLWALRDLLGLTGTKYGCGIGLCGACTVHIDGAPARACVTPVAQAQGTAVTTIEGLAVDGSSPLQQAFVDLNVAQCGYCQPGQLMAAAALLAEHPDPSTEEVEEAMSGVLCRCGTYLRIQRAIELAVERTQ